VWVLLLPLASGPAVVGAILGLPFSKMWAFREDLNPLFTQDIQSEQKNVSQRDKTTMVLLVLRMF